MVHYQIPASVDIYVHRSGRTARGDADGLAIALVAPKEAPRYSALQQVIMAPLLQRVQGVLSCPKSATDDVHMVPAGILLYIHRDISMLALRVLRLHEHLYV